MNEKREIFSQRESISPKHFYFLNESGRIEDYEEKIAEHNLTKLGLAYAKRYAKKEITYVYENRRNGKVECFNEEQNLQEKPYLKFFSKDFTFTLGSK